MAQRIGAALTPINLVSALLLLFGGIGLSRLLAAPRFGLALVLVALLAVIPLALLLIVKPRFGVFLLFVVSMVIIEIKRLAWYMEVGLAIEFLEGVLAIGLASSIVARRDLWRLSSPLTVPVLGYLFFLLLMALHPSLPTIYNIVYALRDVVNFGVPFLAALYLIRDRKELHFFLCLWLGTAVAISLYGLFQNYFGLLNWERAWLSISPTHLLYGRVRIFSTLGSADALGMHMAISIVLALGLAFHTADLRVKLAALSMVPLFALVDLYTLTRGAYLGAVVGVLALGLITRSPSMLLSLLLGGGLAVGWYQLNQGSLLAIRLMTMFSPDQDASYEVRQNYIQEFTPVIMDNPFGFGPATSGRQGGTLLEWGGLDPSLVQSLAGVPTDNYYFRIALEQGWVGLMLFLGLLLTVYVVGLRVYFSARDPLVKWLAASLLAAYMAMTVSSWSNNYFAHVELKLFFWFSLGVLANLPRIEAESAHRAARGLVRHQRHALQEVRL